VQILHLFLGSAKQYPEEIASILQVAPDRVGSPRDGLMCE